MYACVCVLPVTVPLSPDGVSCGQLTNRSVQVLISPPSVSQSAYNISLYEVTYTSVVEEFPANIIHDVANVKNSVTNDVLLNAVGGVTYRVTAVSRSGHLTSRPVLTTCTAGQFSFVLTT